LLAFSLSDFFLSTFHSFAPPLPYLGNSNIVRSSLPHPLQVTDKDKTRQQKRVLNTSTFLEPLFLLPPFPNFFLFQNILSPRASTTNILSEPVTGYLVPLNLLSRNRQLSPQRLERALAKGSEATVEFFLVFLFGGGNLLADAGASSRCDGSGYGLGCQKPHVAVLVVVHVDLERSFERAG